MAKMVRNNTLRKHRMVFQNYVRLLKKYGTLANKMSKDSLYAEAGEFLGYESKVSGMIIRSFLKKSRAELVNIISDQESDDALNVAIELSLKGKGVEA